MDVSLVQNRLVNFSGPITIGDIHRLNNLPRLRSAIIPISSIFSENVPPALKKIFETSDNWKVKLYAGMTNDSQGVLGMLDEEPGGILETLETLTSCLGAKVKLSLSLWNVYDSLGNEYKPFNLNTIDYKFERLGCRQVFGCRNYHIPVNSDSTDFNKSLENWSMENYSFTANVTITASIADKHSNNFEISIPTDKLCINKKILTDEIGCDVTIIPENGMAVKCHKSFLSAQSSVFERMFQDDMKEAKTSTVEIPDMTESSVRTFLAYLYYWSTDEAEKNSKICFDLYHAGHKYDIAGMEESMKCILMSKQNDWFDVEVGLKLFLFTRNLENGKELKEKSARVLKSKFSLLEQSEGYKDLFKKDPAAAMELCKYAFSL